MAVIVMADIVMAYRVMACLLQPRAKKHPLPQALAYCQHLGTCRRRTPRTRGRSGDVQRRVSPETFPMPPLRYVLPLGGSACTETLLKVDPSACTETLPKYIYPSACTVHRNVAKNIYPSACTETLLKIDPSACTETFHF